MPPVSASQQRGAITQFIDLTGVSERQAIRFLKSSGYKVDEAIEAYYSSGVEKGPSPLETKLEALFDSLRDPQNDEKDKLELDSTMSYLSGILKVNMENAQLLVVHELVQAPSIGEITKRGFVDGWKTTSVPATNEDHASHIRKLCNNLSTDQTLFRKVYKHTFVVGREKDQKSLALDTAMTYWQILFSPPGMAWKTTSHDWLNLWETFLREKWTRSVNKDMWNMTFEFAVKSMADETLSFWNEDGAWPSVIDDFVAWSSASNDAIKARLEKVGRKRKRAMSGCS